MLDSIARQNGATARTIDIPDSLTAEIEDRCTALNGAAACLSMVADGLFYSPSQLDKKASDATNFLSEQVRRLTGEIMAVLYPDQAVDRKKEEAAS